MREIIFFFGGRNMLLEALKRRILVLDGAMGTMLASYGEKPCYEVLNKTKENLIQKIHEKYIEAGADIITTNSFNCNQMALQKYHLKESVYDLTKKSVEIAKKATKNSKKAVYILGSIGPSIANLPEDMKSWKQSYFQQILGLLDGGVDALLLETIYDENKANCILGIIEEVLQAGKREIPVFCSMTINQNGKLLTGTSITRAVEKMDRPWIVGFGLNCSYGMENIVSFLPELIRATDKYYMVYANAGFPNEKGEYTENIEEMLELLQPFLEKHLIHIVGGCCGTNEKYTYAFAKKIALLAER